MRQITMTKTDQAELRQLDDDELDLVSGGNIAGAVAMAGKLLSRAVTGLMDVLTGGNSFPIKIDFSALRRPGNNSVRCWAGAGQPNAAITRLLSHRIGRTASRPAATGAGTSGQLPERGPTICGLLSRAAKWRQTGSVACGHETSAQPETD
jgi:hypothetical protein